MTQAVLDGAAEAGAKLVFADNLYMYGPPADPMSEKTPQRGGQDGPHAHRDGRRATAGPRGGQAACHDRSLV
jgi:hypothetical protein